MIKLSYFLTNEESNLEIVIIITEKNISIHYESEHLHIFAITKYITLGLRLYYKLIVTYTIYIIFTASYIHIPIEVSIISGHFYMERITIGWFSGI